MTPLCPHHAYYSAACDYADDEDDLGARAQGSPADLHAFLALGIWIR